MTRYEITDNLSKRAVFYLEKRVSVHIRTATKRNYNGLIMEVVGEDFMILRDRVLGEIPLYFKEILILEPYRNEGVER